MKINTTSTIRLGLALLIMSALAGCAVQPSPSAGQPTASQGPSLAITPSYTAAPTFPPTLPTESVSGTPVPAFTVTATPTVKPGVTTSASTAAPTPRPSATYTAKPVQTPAPELDLAQFSFPGKFSQSVIETPDSYISPNINLTLEKVVTTISGSTVTYYVIDIYVRSLKCFSAGIAYSDSGSITRKTTPEMCKAYGAVAAISGDFFNFRSKGRIVRNGKVYKNTAASEDVCALYCDGTMVTYSPSEFDMDTALARGVWQTWGFGPALLDDNGKPLASFNTTVSTRNPRSAVGYYEPGHYCFVTIDGRQSGYSAGMTTAQMAEMFSEMGCMAAFNLDGGQTAVMAWRGETANIPYKGGRRVSDILMISDIS